MSKPIQYFWRGVSILTCISALAWVRSCGITAADLAWETVISSPGWRSGLTWSWTPMTLSWRKWYLLQFFGAADWFPKSLIQINWRNEIPIPRGIFWMRLMAWTGASSPSCPQAFSLPRLSFPAGIARLADSPLVVQIPSPFPLIWAKTMLVSIRVQALEVAPRRSDCSKPRISRGLSWNSRKKLTTAIRRLFPRFSSSPTRSNHFLHVRFCSH